MIKKALAGCPHDSSRKEAANQPPAISKIPEYRMFKQVRILNLAKFIFWAQMRAQSWLEA